MKFECLVDLLKEKRLVKVEKNKINGITVSVRFKSEYSEVIDKIINNLPDDTVMKRAGKFVLTITTFNDIHNWIKFYLEGKSKGYLKIERYFTYDERKIVVETMKKLSEFEVSYDPWTAEFVIIDIEMRDKELKAEQKKHNKVVEFLNSLP